MRPAFYSISRHSSLYSLPILPLLRTHLDLPPLGFSLLASHIPHIPHQLSPSHPSSRPSPSWTQLSREPPLTPLRTKTPNIALITRMCVSETFRDSREV